MRKQKNKLHNARILIATFMLAAATGNVMEDADTAQQRPHLHNGQLVYATEIPQAQAVIARPRLALTGQTIGGVASLPELATRALTDDIGLVALEAPGEPKAPQFGGFGGRVSIPAPLSN